MAGREAKPEYRRYLATSGAREEMECVAESGIPFGKEWLGGCAVVLAQWVVSRSRIVVVEQTMVRREVWRMTRRWVKRVVSPGKGFGGEKGSFRRGKGREMSRAAHPDCPRNGLSWYSWVVALVLLVRAKPEGGKLPPLGLRAW
jgi:hypothetical protein